MAKHRLTWTGDGSLDLSQVLDDRGVPIIFTKKGDEAVVNEGSYRHPLVQRCLKSGLTATSLDGAAPQAPAPVKAAPAAPKAAPAPPPPKKEEPKVQPKEEPKEAPKKEEVKLADTLTPTEKLTVKTTAFSSEDPTEKRTTEDEGDTDEPESSKPKSSKGRKGRSK